MKPFWKKEAKSGGPMVALSDLAHAQWSGAGAMAREGFERNPVGYRCVRMIAEAAASVPLVTDDRDGALAKLLERPNVEDGGADLLERFFGHLMISGSAFLEAVRLDGEVRELHVLRPDRMKPLKGARGHLLGWVYKVGSEERRILRQADGCMPVMQLKLFHPSDDYEGHAPLKAAARAVDIHNAGGAWSKALMDNSARPSGALVYSGGEQLTGDQLKDLRDDLERIYQGPGHAGRPMVLQGGLDWRPMSLTPSDMDFVEARNVAAREIALAFGVPPMLLGIPGDATYANYKEANSAFWRLTILPLVNRAARALSAWLGHSMGARLRADLEEVPAFQDERAAQWKRIEAASFLTDEEKRRLVGLAGGHSA